MCGIVGYVGHRPCTRILLDGLRRLEYRGYDSAGIAVFDGTSLRRVRAEGKLDNLESAVRSQPLDGTIGIGHTRWATHGKPTEQNAHPHAVDGLVVIHNGIIENHLELRSELAAEGAVFTSETDTEIIAHLLARSPLRGTSLVQALRSVLKRVRGSYAIVALDEKNPTVLAAARLASPMVAGIGDGENFIASDVPAIMSHTRDVIFLNDHDFVEVRADGLTITDRDGAPVERAVKRITWDPISAEKQGYRHFMLKEIHEQPDRVIDTLRGRISLERNTVEFQGLALDPAWLQRVDEIVILACGTSFHAGMVARYALESLARIRVSVELASEFRYREPVLQPNTLVIAISQSGETADTLAATREARRLGAKALAICNVMESSLTRECDATIYTHAGPEIGVASTKAFTTQLAALYLFAIYFGQLRGALSEERTSKLLRGLREVPGHMEACIAQYGAIRAFAPKYSDAHSFLFLGRGYQYPIALEGALKLKEISYIHAEGYAAGEMKHGPIALIDEALPVVVIAPNNAHFEKALSNLEEVRARGGKVLAVTSGDTAHIQQAVDDLMIVPDIDEVLQPLVTVVPLQLLSYAIADLKGTDIDQPRNLAKSVTVE